MLEVDITFIVKPVEVGDNQTAKSHPAKLISVEV